MTIQPRSFSPFQSRTEQTDGVKAHNGRLIDAADGVLENSEAGKGNTDVLYQITCRDVKTKRSKKFLAPKNHLEEMALLELEDPLSPKVVEVFIETTVVGSPSD